MFNASFPQASFSYFSAEGSAAHFLVISSEEQEILNNIPGWPTNENAEVTVTRYCQIPHKSSASLENVTNAKNSHENGIIPKNLESNKKLTVTSRSLSTSLKNLVDSISFEPLICLQKFKSLTDLNVLDQQQTNLQAFSRTTTAVLNYSHHNNLGNKFHKSLTDLPKTMRNTEPFNKFRLCLIRTKRKLERLKEKVMNDDIESKNIHPKRKFCESAHPLTKEVEISLIPKENAILSQHGKKSINQPIRNTVASRYPSLPVVKKSLLSSPQLKATKFLNGLSTNFENVTQHIEATTKTISKTIPINNTNSLKQKSDACVQSDNRELSGKCTLNVADRAQSPKASNLLIPESNNTNNNQTSNQLSSGTKKISPTVNNELSQNLNIPPNSMPLNATYVVKTNHLAKTNPETETFSVYEIGEETQKICLGIGSDSLSNSWITTSEVAKNEEDLHTAKSADKHTPVVIHVASVLQSSQQCNKSQDTQGSNELFNCSQESHKVKNVSPTNNARRKLRFSQETPTNASKESLIDKPQIISPEIGVIPKTKSASSLLQLPLAATSPSKISSSKGIFHFTSNEVRKMLDVIWDTYS